ncbi:ABC transporter permease [Fulvivirga sp.]|uniref:ABC transporter permease n=1 Tax=Fulvivirga sp. TaxID=1931237 RepID=UPI0032EE7047
MNLSYFIAKRIADNEEQSFSSTIHKIAIGSIAVGLGAMIVSFLILRGFQDTVRDKIYSFSAHLQLTKYTLDNSFEEVPISLNTGIFTNPEDFPYVRHVQEYSHKAGLIKAEDEVLGIVFKGVSARFDTANFNTNLIEGRFIEFDSDDYSKEVVISKVIADKLNIELNEDILVHFFQNPPRVRRLTVVGKYETNLSEYYDNKFIIGDIDLIKRLNDWPDSLAGGLEVFVNDVDKMDEAEEQLNATVPLDLYVEKVSDKYIQVFEWLFLISRQVNIFLGIILFVVCVNMVSIILILIMERTQMIGLLKSFGGTDALIRRIFSYSGVQLIFKGLVLGNILGLTICALQYYFQVIRLNPADYYMSYVPISWNWDIVIALNLLTFVIVTLIVALPTAVIARIKPIKSIKFD